MRSASYFGRYRKFFFASRLKEKGIFTIHKHLNTLRRQTFSPSLILFQDWRNNKKLVKSVDRGMGR